MPSARPTQSLAALGILLALAAWTFPDSTVPSAAAARRRTNGALAPFGRPCSLEHGVRFCPTATLAQRVPSFDGVPLDVDVTLPASGRGPFPTIVMLHGAGQNKTAFEAGAPAGDDKGTYAYNNVYYARHGLAVANDSPRGSGSFRRPPPPTASPPAPTRPAAGEAPAAPSPRAPIRPARKASGVSPTNATKRVTRSSCSASWRTSTSPRRGAWESPESPTAVPRASSSHTCATGSGCPTAASPAGAARLEGRSKSTRRGRAGHGLT